MMFAILLVKAWLGIYAWLLVGVVILALVDKDRDILRWVRSCPYEPLKTITLLLWPVIGYNHWRKQVWSRSSRI